MAEFLKRLQLVKTGVDKFTREVLELVMNYLDGQSLLVCTEVSQEFADTVKYMSEARGLWKKCFQKERGLNYPFYVVSKVFPHIEKWNHPPEWGRLYEATVFGSRIGKAVQDRITEVQPTKYYSEIVDCETHGEFILVLLKYNKNFAKYNRIVVIDSKNRIVDKTSHFTAEMIYVSTPEGPYKMNDNAFDLYCDKCDLCAVPLTLTGRDRGFPKLSRDGEYVLAEHMNGETFYMSLPEGKQLVTYGNSFHCGRFVTPEELIEKDSKHFKVWQYFETLIITFGSERREFTTFKDINACVSASLLYGSLLLLGTDTGMVYGYKLDCPIDMVMLDLKQYTFKADVNKQPILCMSVIETLEEFRIVCCTEKRVFVVHLKRKVYNHSVPAPS